ncbi:ABC-type anion transport system [Collimonas arenae]|uniref:ABC-type anion transport system n=1 Tax=Collimonas arenae TaxID=279058 RepID=A0A0A1FGE7_9BURK|nr:ABC transporter permease subunit [Collimonas arenae]AIY43641.1 ABC-type anion transport system [Collimonas arenae]
MPKRSYPDITSPQLRTSWRFGWIDILVVMAMLLLFWLVFSLSGDMRVHFDELHPPPLSLDVDMIPYYTARTVLRMFIAFGASLLFTFIWGYVAAKSPRARKVMLPILDILQSVPVLGFLSITVTGFLALFPGSLLGVECASIFAVFTAQAWNMTFGFYHSLVTIPAELSEAASIFRLNRWQRFTTLELPTSAIGLMWNSMMSFGGGWFFVAQSEAITVLNKNIKLPGLGSYMAAAVEAGNTRAALYAIGAMILTILLIDQLVWRPLVAWAEKFKLENTEAKDSPQSWMLDLLRRSNVVGWLFQRIGHFFARVSQRVSMVASDVSTSVTRNAPTLFKQVLRVALWLAIAAGIAWLVIDAFGVAREIKTEMTGAEMLHVVWLGILTFLRVLAMMVVATLIWTPIGVWIGLRPRVARIAQPLAQIAASFPVNMTFPFIVVFFITMNIPINIGSILLMALGTQWYILFNVIAGAMAIPTDLREAAQIFGLRKWRLWKTVIIPAIFPFWVTGAVTATGGAWNASIVAEVASWGQNKLVADGLGAYIAHVTEKGDKPAIYFSIVVMSLFVVVINRVLWRRLYALAEHKFKLD